MNLKDLYLLYMRSSGICTDTRKIKPSSIYLALKGENFNGNLFAKTALDKGCIYAIVDEDVEYDHRFIKVENCLKTLQDLANLHRNALDIPVIAITGSNGKTTTKELLKNTLEKKYKVHATPGNFNNHIGLPLTILSAPKDTEILITEMGDNKPGDILELCHIAEPDFAYITNIGKDHLEGYGSFEGNVKTKKELFDYACSNNKQIFFNEKDELVKSIIPYNCKKVSFGTDLGKNSLKFISANPYIHYQDSGNRHVYTQLPGKYNFANIEIVWAIASFLGVIPEHINAGIASYVPSNNRSQLIKGRANDVFLDAYNANPSSMVSALDSFNEIDSEKKKSVILGDMLELGKEANKEHQDIIEKLKTFIFNHVLLVGSLFGECELPSNFQCFKDTEELKLWLQENPMKDNFVLIKGSRGIKLEVLLENL